MYKNPAMPLKEVQKSTIVSDVSQQAGDDNSDLLINNLSYHQPEALSLAVSRTYNRQYFQRADYKQNETAVIDFNTGTDFIDPMNSYLTFTCWLIASATTATAHFGVGSAMNLIRQIVIKSRSGTELDRVERANVWSCYNSRYTLSEAFLTRQGLLEGFQANKDIPVPNLNAVVASSSTANTGPQRFCIPLNRLAPFFNPVKKGQKLCPQLLSGLHMEIVWEDFRTALVQGAGSGTITGYQISNLAIMTDSVCMTDSVQQAINMQSADNGLEYAYPRIFTSTDAMSSGGTTLSTQVRKAVSQANIAYSICLNSSYTLDVAYDSMKAMAFDANRWQFRLGALYYPLQAIEDTNVHPNNGRESYIQAIETWDKLKHPHSESSISLNDFIGNGLTGATAGSMGMLCVSLEKDTALNYSGLPCNNSRVLENNVVFDTTLSVGKTREVVTFLEYSSVARAYVDNTAVEI